MHSMRGGTGSFVMTFVAVSACAILSTSANFKFWLNGRPKGATSREDGRSGRINDEQVILEIEAKYVRCLGLFLECMIRPICVWADELQVEIELHSQYDGHRFMPSPDVTPADAELISSNLEQIFSFHSQMILKMKSLGSSEAVVDSWSSMIQESAKLHSKYVYNLDAVREKLTVLLKRNGFHTFLRACELHLSRSIEFQNSAHINEMILLPTYHILEYSYLLPESDERLPRFMHRLANAALRAHRESCSWARNDRFSVLSYGMSMQLTKFAEFQPLIKQGSLTVFVKSGPIDCEFLLFKDAILFGYEEKMLHNKYHVHVLNKSIDLHKCYVIDLANGFTDNTCSFILLTSSLSLFISAKNPIERAVWVSSICGAIEHLDHSDSYNYHQHILSDNAWFMSSDPLFYTPETSGNPKICKLWKPNERMEPELKKYVLPGTAPFYSDVNSSVQLEAILNNPKQLNCFRKHVEYNRCSENLVFWEMVNDFKSRRFVGKRQALIDAARAIVDRFIREGSPDQVNISASMRSQLLDEVDSGDVNLDTFDECLKEIIHIMCTDTFIHFLSGPFFVESLEYGLDPPNKKKILCGTIKFDELVECNEQIIQTIRYIDRLNNEEPTVTELFRPSYLSTSVDEKSREHGRKSSEVQDYSTKMENILQATDIAIKSAQKSNAWYPKNSSDAYDWFRKICGTAEMFPVGIVISDMVVTGNPLAYANDAFCKMTGYSKEEIYGKNCRFLQGPDTEVAAVEQIREHLSKCQDICVKITNYRKNGERFKNLLCMRPVFDPQHACRFVIGVQFDIKADRYLRRRLGQLNEIVRALPKKMIFTSTFFHKVPKSTDMMNGSQMVEINTHSLKMNNFSLSNGGNLLDEAIQIALSTKCWDFKMGPSLDPKQWAKTFSQSVNYFPVSIVVADMTRSGIPVIVVNEAFTKMTGYTREETIGRNCKFLQGKGSEIETIGHMREKISKGQDCYAKMTNYCKNGRKFDNLIGLKPVYDIHGIYHFTIGILFEVTDNTRIKSYLRSMDRLCSLLPYKVVNVSSRMNFQNEDTEWKYDLMLTAIGNAGDLPYLSFKENSARSSHWIFPGIHRKNVKESSEFSHLSHNYSKKLNALKKMWSNPSLETPQRWYETFTSSIADFPISVSVSSTRGEGFPMNFVNEQFCKMTGYSVREVIGLSCRFLQGPNTEDEARALIRSKLMSVKDCHVRITNYKKSGEQFQNLLSLRTVRDAQGVAHFIVGVQFEFKVDRFIEDKLNDLYQFFKLIPSIICGASSAAKRQKHLFNIAVGRISELQPFKLPSNESFDDIMNVDDSGGYSLNRKEKNFISDESTDLWLECLKKELQDVIYGVLILDGSKGNTIVFSNESFSKMTEYCAEDMSGRSCLHLRGPESEEESVSYFSYCLSSKRHGHTKMRLYKKGGEWCDCLISTHPIENEASEDPRFTIIVLFPIDSHENLITRIERLDAFLYALPKSTSLDDIESSHKVDMILVAVGSCENPEVAANGERSAYMTGFGLDAFKYSESQCIFNDWLSKFCNFAETFPACIVVSDMTATDTPMMFVNQEFCRVTGYSKEESVGRNCRFLQGPETESEAVDTIRTKLSNAQDCIVKLTNYKKSGEKFMNLLFMRPIFDASGVYRYCIGVQFEMVSNSHLKLQLSGLEKLLKVLPGRLKKSASFSSNDTTKKIVGEADMMLYAMGPPPAK